jgi:hypothetical protein
MSTAKLNIWITERGDPCRITNRTLFVHVLHCNGKVLEWCDRKYLHIPAKCGHLELEIPVGCYIVGAVENPDGIPPLGNHLTHIAIVRADCGRDYCVTLFDPTFHQCAHWFQVALNNHVQAQAVPRQATEAARNAAQVVKALVAQVEQDPFTTQQAATLAAPLPKPDAKKTGGSKKGGINT